MEIFVGGVHSVNQIRIVRALSKAGHHVFMHGPSSARYKRAFIGLASEPVHPHRKRKFDYDVVIFFASSRRLRGGEKGHRSTPPSENLSALSQNINTPTSRRLIVFSSVSSLLRGTTSLSQLKTSSEAWKQQNPGGEHWGHVFIGTVAPEQYAAKNRVLRQFVEIWGRALLAMLSTWQPVVLASDIVKLVTHEEGVSSTATNHILVSSLQNRSLYKMWTYSLDMTFVLASLSISPLLLLIYFLILVVNGPPGLFAQDRIGANGSIFKLIKFRTMVNGTEGLGTHLVDPDSVTRIGSILRKTKIDELTQALNVAKREMNLIGPRPCLPSQHEVIEARRVVAIEQEAPGLTGWAQVNGISMKEPLALAELDSIYIACRSVEWDLHILQKTFGGRNVPPKENQKVGSLLRVRIASAN